METRETKTDQCVIIGISGRLDTTTYSQLESKLSELIGNHQVNILVDCSEMDYVSSSGLRIFLMALKKVTSENGRFVLCCLQDSIRELFEISGFTSVFELHSSVDDALKVF